MSRFNYVVAACALVALLAGSAAEADTVMFSAPVGDINTSFADGTFSQNLSGGVRNYPDGFYTASSTSAFNGYGQNGETIYFTTAVELNSLILTPQNPPFATSYTVDLYGSSGLLTSQTLSGTAMQALTFNELGVTSVMFNFTGGSDVYGDGRDAAFYNVADITYDATPLPAALPLFATGLGALGLLGWRRKRKNAAA
jgi:hypothetical protein